MTPPSSHWPSEDDRPPPEPTFIRKVAEDLWEGLLPLVVWTAALWMLGLLAITVGVASAPLGFIVATLTLAPGLAGMMVLTGNLARGGFARLGAAWRGTIRLYRRSVALALPLVLMLALILVTANSVTAFPGRPELLIAWAFQISLGLTALILHLYLFPILALHDAPLKQTVGLAMVLVGKYAWQTLALLAVGAALLAAALLLPVAWLLAPGVWCVVVTNATWRMVRPLLPGTGEIDK